MIVPFDTLEMAKRLEAGGFSPQQADAFVGAMATAANVANFATNSDLERGLAGVRSEIAILRGEMHTGFATLRSEMQTGNALTESRVVIRIGVMMAAFAGLVIAAIRYLPAAHS